MKNQPKFQSGDKIWYVWGDKFLTDPQNWSRADTICHGTIYEVHRYGKFYYVQPGVRLVSENDIFPTESAAELFVASQIKEKVSQLIAAGNRLKSVAFTKSKTRLVQEKT